MVVVSDGVGWWTGVTTDSQQRWGDGKDGANRCAGCRPLTVAGCCRGRTESVGGVTEGERALARHLVHVSLDDGLSASRHILELCYLCDREIQLFNRLYVRPSHALSPGL